MTRISGGDDEREARRHAARASLYWLLGELFDASLRRVDLESTRAMLEVIQPSPDLAPVWILVREALQHADGEHPPCAGSRGGNGHGDGHGRASATTPIARDLRALARAADRASLGYLKGDLLVVAESHRRHAELMTAGAEHRLREAAESLRRCQLAPCPRLAEALHWLVGDARELRAADSAA